MIATERIQRFLSLREHSFCQKHKAIKKRNTPLVMLFITDATRQLYYITVFL